MIKENLQRIQQKIREYEVLHHREPHSVALLAASKLQSVEKIQAAIKAGQFAFGENYLQEALKKMESVKDPRIEWHFIGTVQRNKTRKIAEHFAWVQSIDDASIAKRLNDARPDHLAPLNCCIEVNVSGEPTKSGIKIAEVHDLARYIHHKLPRLILRGLMAIPAPSKTFLDQRKPYAMLQSLFNELKAIFPEIDTLSMGMSDDFEAAIAEGATFVRVGTGIFGERNREGNIA